MSPSHRRPRHILLAIVLGLATVMVGGCTHRDATDANATSTADTGADRDIGGKGDYFGEDDRKEPYEQGVTDRQRSWARATALITKRSKLVESDDGGSFQLRSETFGERLDMCEDVRFADQPSGGYCTAFLVSPDTLVTAGHCLEFGDFSCDSGRFVFDFGYYDRDRDIRRIDRGDVYRCAEVVASTVEGDGPGELDYGVVRLQRPVDDRTPLEVRQEGRPEVGDVVATIGYSSGLPVKIDADGVVIESADVRMTSTSDAFPGNSGGPVINVGTGHVEGLVSSEQGDGFVDDDEQDCHRPKRCTGTGEHQCTGMSSVLAEHWRHVIGGSTDSGGDHADSSDAGPTTDAGRHSDI